MGFLEKNEMLFERLLSVAFLFVASIIADIMLLQFSMNSKEHLL